MLRHDKMNYITQHCDRLLNHAQKMQMLRDLCDMDIGVLSDGPNCVYVRLHSCSEKIVDHIYSVVKARYDELNTYDPIDLSHLDTPDKPTQGFR
jgi:hypothetical protein